MFLNADDESGSVDDAEEEPNEKVEKGDDNEECSQG